MMTVRHWMSRHPTTISRDASVRDARRLLQTREIRHIPVVEAGRLVGIISDRDVRVDDETLARAGDVGALGDILGGTRPVEDVMATPVQTVRPTDSLRQAANLMQSRRISALPVVDAADRLIGIITTTDLLRAFLTSGSGEDAASTDKQAKGPGTANAPGPSDSRVRSRS